MIYLIITIFLLFLTYLYDYKGEKRGLKISFYLTLIIFIALAGLRYRIGGDTVMYMKYYENLHPLDAIGGSDFSRSRFAPGYLLITSIFKTFTPDFIYFQLFHSIVINCVVFAFIKRYCKHIFFSLLIFFFYLYVYLLFEQIRESFAVAIFLLAWPWFKNGIWWKWYIASLCAFMFHVSAFFMFLLPLICLPGIRELFKFGRRTILICLLVFVIGLVMQTVFFRYVELLAVTDSMLDRVQTYGNITRADGLNINRALGVTFQFIAYPLIALYVIYIQKKKNIRLGIDEKELSKETMMTLMSVYVSILTVFIGILIRYNNYFFFFAILMMGNWAFTRIYAFKKLIRIGYLYWIFLFLPMFAVNFYFFYLTPVNKGETLYSYMRYYPYSSVIDQTVDQDREKTIVYIRRK